MKHLSAPIQFHCWAALVLFTASGCAEKPPTIHQGQAHEPPKPKSLVEQPSAAPAITGKVIAVKDGDTIVVLRDREEITVRLEGIDCPESGQAFGIKAKQAASNLCFGKEVTLRVTGKDRYGRTLADVILPDEASLNQELVRTGHAWWFRKYSDDPTLKKLEADATENKRGLWSDPKPVAPWDWRAAQRAKSTVPPSEINVVPNGVSIVALLPNPTGEDVGNEQVTFSNSSDLAVELSGWKLLDKAGNVFLLSGRIGPKQLLVVTMTEATMPLNNDGDEVVLIDGEGLGRSRVSYSGSQSGVVVRFANEAIRNNEQ